MTTTIVSQNTDLPRSSALLDEEWIRLRAEYPSSKGLEEVQAYHRARFMEAHGAELDGLRRAEHVWENRTLHGEHQLRRAKEVLESLWPLSRGKVESNETISPSHPWNVWEMIMFCLCGIGVLALVVFGILNISFNLLESGLVTFMDHPIRAYFWSALLPVGALAVKVGWDFIRSEFYGRLYAWACFGIGMLGVGVWICGYALVYPALSLSVEDQIQNLSLLDQPQAEEGSWVAGGAKTVDAVLVGSQAVAEIFLSALLGIQMTQIYSRHRPIRFRRDADFVHWEAIRLEWEKSLLSDELELGRIRAQRCRLEQGLETMMYQCTAMYQRELARKDDVGYQREKLIREMVLHLRSSLGHLEEVGKPSYSPPVGRNGWLENKVAVKDCAE